MTAHRFPALLLCIAGISTLTASSAFANGHALIIGNGAYDHARKLPNAPNDANDFSAALKSSGWTTTVVIDADVREMIRALRIFCETAAGADSALFFYAGHGIEVKGRNYLLPTDAELDEADGEDALPLETLALDKVLRDLASSRIRLKTIVLDCCRDNPLDRSWLASRSSGGGMAKVEQDELPEGAMLVFSTAPGKTAADGRSRNSPFTSALLDRMSAGAGSVADVFGDVAKTLGSRQPAWIRFDGSGVSFTAFRDYPLVPGDGPIGGGVPPEMPQRVTLEDQLRAATIDRPYVNSLGMEFIPVPGKPDVYMCRTETRVRDFRAYVEATDYVQTGGAWVNKIIEKEGSRTTKWQKDLSASWEFPGFAQTESHPVVCVNWEEAANFCQWLSRQEPELEYRLPIDDEWSSAVGSLSKYVWGNQFPAPPGAENLLGDEFNDFISGNLATAFEGKHRDGAAFTAPVASFRSSRFSFFDLGGNVHEWCENWYQDEMNAPDVIASFSDRGFDDKGGKQFRTWRGGSWHDSIEFPLRTSYRGFSTPITRFDQLGFRCVAEIPD